MPAAAPAAPSSLKGVQLWWFGSGRDAPKPGALARHYDVVIGANRIARHVAAMRRINRGMLVAPYGKGTAVIGRDFAWVRRHRPRWLLRNRAGRIIRNVWGAHLINPASPSVRRWQADRARAAQRAGWSAVYLDSMGTYGLEGPGGLPVNPRTRRPFTERGWVSSTVKLATAVDRAVRIPVLVNGYRNGKAYWENVRRLSRGSQGGVFEACFRDASAPLSRWPSVELWQAQVGALSDVQRRGDIALCMTKAWGAGGERALRRWHAFARASFLLANRGRSFFHFDATRRAGPPANSKVPIGTPTGKRKRKGRVWTRRFTGGAVVVNPGERAARVRVLGRTILVKAHTGRVIRG
jgi:hypothetical protein